MAIEVARLAAGRATHNNVRSVNTTIIGQIYTNSNPDIKAVVKSLTPRQIANELIASSLLAELRLPAPKGFLVFADPSDAFGPHSCRHTNGLDMYFASELSPFPTFYTFFNMQDAVALSAAAQYDGWGNIVGIDEWIANTDRHLNNFLYDGNTVYLFDHDRCLSGPTWTPADLVADTAYPCHFVVDVVHSSMPEERRKLAVRLANEIANRALTLDLQRVFENSLAQEVNHGLPRDLPAALDFLRLRIPHISRLCAQRLAVGGLI